MKADFTRGFAPDRHRGQSYRRVLLQKGRAILDSDVAAQVDATDTAIRDAVRLTACRAGSPDLGFLVTPGRLLAQFDGTLGNRFEVEAPAEAVRDFSSKYLDRLPSLRIGGPGGRIRVSLAETLAAEPIRLWARADNGGATIQVNGTAVAIPGGPTLQPVDLTASGGELVIDVDPAARAWLALVETRAESAAPAVALHLAAGSYEIDGLTTATPGGAWPLLAGPAATALAGAAESPPDTLLLAYLELHEQHVTHVEDRGILEEALGGDIDTTTRTRVAPQVKLASLGVTDRDAIAAALATPSLAGGTLILGTASASTAADPCDLPVPGGYTGAENRLYRIEVHDTGAGGTRFKWSRENGAELFPVRFPDGLAPGAMASSLVVGTGYPLNDGDLVELISDATEAGDSAPGALGTSGFTRPARAQGRLLRLAGGAVVTGTDRTFDLLDPVDETPVTDVDSGAFGSEGLKLRRWSGLIVAAADGTYPLEKGIEAQLAGGFEPGDWWQYEARSGRANLAPPGDGSPDGPERLFAPLAVLRQTPAGEPMLLEAWLDTRFPRLCEIEADDVSYDGTRVGTDADTVQEALDELFGRASGGCGEIPVPPDGDLRDVIDAIPDGGDARICLGPGHRAIASQVLVSNKGHITITGLGGGSVLVGQARAILRFSGCASVTLADFALQASGTAGHLLEIVDCGEVTLRNLSLEAQGAVVYGDSAIRIRGTQIGRLGRAVVEHCRLTLDHGDTGIEILQAADAVVRDCTLRIPETRFDLLARMADPGFASVVGRVFLNQLSFDVDTNIFVGSPAVDLQIQDFGRRGIALATWGRDPLFFTTHASLDARLWAQVAQANPPPNPDRRDSQRGLIRRVRRGIARFSLGLDPAPARIPTRTAIALRQVGNLIAQSAPTISGSTGIVVAAPLGPVARIASEAATELGGALRPSVQVTGNRVDGFTQGIRVAGSTRGTGHASGRAVLFADVQVDGNLVGLRAPLYARSRWGILVGSAVSAAIRNNRVAITRDTDLRRDPDRSPALAPTDGIRAWGDFGPHVQIERNACYFTTDGVRLHPIAAARPGYLWKVSEAGGTPANAYLGPGQAEITS